MGETRQIRLARARAAVAADVAAIDEVVRKIAAGGVASASISAAGGSKSYSRLDLNALRALRTDLASRLAALDRALTGRGLLAVRHLVTVRS